MEVLVDDLLKRVSRNELENEKRSSVESPSVIHQPCDPWMTDFRRCLGFLLDARDGIFIARELERQALERDGESRVGIDGFVNRGHSALAKHA